MSCLLVMFIYTAALAFSWITTCGIFYLITLCFSWVFTWKVATGIWLLLLMLGAICSPKFK